MKHLLLGELTGLRVSEVALGTGRLGSTQSGELDTATAKATITAFLDGGGNFIDTSSAYQGGRAEEVIGATLSGAARDAVVISSKFGRTPLREPGVASTGNGPGEPPPGVRSTSRETETQPLQQLVEGVVEAAAGTCRLRSRVAPLTRYRASRADEGKANQLGGGRGARSTPLRRRLGPFCLSHITCRTAGLAKSRRPVLPCPAPGSDRTWAGSGLSAAGFGPVESGL